MVMSDAGRVHQRNRLPRRSVHFAIVIQCTLGRVPNGSGLWVPSGSLTGWRRRGGAAVTSADLAEAAGVCVAVDHRGRMAVLTLSSARRRNALDRALAGTRVRV